QFFYTTAPLFAAMEGKRIQKGGQNSILVICAHSDDEIFGVGGTCAKYAKEGKPIYTVIFSYGERSHPHFKPAVARKMRMDEARKADKIIGGSGVIFLGLHEGKFREEFQEKQLAKFLAGLIRKHDPEKIFTHSSDDAHADHRAVHRIVLDVFDSLHCSANVYTFDIWNLFSFKQHDTPKLVVDITETFKKKRDALRCFRSQINVFSYAVLNNFLYLAVFAKAILNGIKNDCRYAEVFRLVR
ncbi:MAG: PIG-L deacetylase family protein, partial [Nanoarchaeota archaeon]